MSELPTVVTKAGLQPQAPASLLAQLIALVSAVNPGYTATLPASLIEDISSTDVGALTVCDSARVEAVNSLTPYASNDFLTSQLGQIYIGPGSAPASPFNTSVSVVFSGPPGFIIAVGFTVTDGTYQYVVQDGGVIKASGSTDPLFCISPTSGSWSVPSNTVTGLVTSVPTTSPAITCTNPLAGIPSTVAQTEESYRAEVLQAGQAIAQGMTTMLKTQLAKVPGVQQRLVSVRQQSPGWEVIVGGGDPYQVANAIFRGLFDISTLVGSTLAVTNITAANPGVVTTNLNHGYITGQAIVINALVGMTPLNGTPIPSITVIDEKTFSIGINTSGYPPYVSGGVITPNLRNVVVNLNDYPDVYSVPFVNPPQQTVLVDVTWNTSAPNFVSSAAVAQLGNPPLVDYLNSLAVGAPINEFVMESIFSQAISSILDPSLLTRLIFTVSINGVGVIPSLGTGIIQGDPESYYAATSTSVVITQG